MKADLDQIKNILGKQMDFLRGAYNVKDIGVFGSVARGESTDVSDVDMLVEFSKPVGFFKFIELEEFLGKVIGKKVDLVTKKALKPAIKGDILQEVAYV
ncbi:nucleotidyltransferase family protein [Candidatus Daviesbacteria bacterium]|nr:nucleotidyltransferase family protein [Candidatus Daviesbacteria bacterium]